MTGIVAAFTVLVLIVVPAAVVPLPAELVVVTTLEATVVEEGVVTGDDALPIEVGTASEEAEGGITAASLVDVKLAVVASDVEDVPLGDGVAILVASQTSTLRVKPGALCRHIRFV